jgi:hypothetical protein
MREEASLESSFMSILQSAENGGCNADFEIRFEEGSPLMVHGCFISRCAFFEAFLRNLNAAQGRVFLSKTPRSAMFALLRYLYGGGIDVFLLGTLCSSCRPENGIGFYFAADTEHSQEVDLMFNAMNLALSQMPILETVDALLQARSLGIPAAEAVLVDLMADNFDLVEHLLDKLRARFGDGLVLEIQRSIIYSLVAKNSPALGADVTMNDAV